MTRTFACTTALLTVLCLPLGAERAAAEVELSFYLGTQTAPHSRVEGSDLTGPFSFLAAWEGKPFQAPPYYGVRATWWQTENFGFGVELNHAKVYLDDANLTAAGFTSFELSDGLNIITANAFYRWPGQWANGSLTPYVGGGAGLAVPHVDVERGAQKTFEYQMTGFAVAWMAGVSYAFNDTWGMFAEYKGTYSMNEADLTGGGSFTTDIVTNALNIGISYKF